MLLIRALDMQLFLIAKMHKVIVPPSFWVHVKADLIDENRKETTAGRVGLGSTPRGSSGGKSNG
jgi:hypothetical protein